MRCRIYSPKAGSIQAKFLESRDSNTDMQTKVASSDSSLAKISSLGSNLDKPILPKASIDIIRERYSVTSWPNSQLSDLIQPQQTCDLSRNNTGKAKRLREAFCVISGVMTSGKRPRFDYENDYHSPC